MLFCGMGKFRFAVRTLAAAGFVAAAVTAVQAQFFDDRFPFNRPGGFGNPFAQPQQRPADYSHAPSPRKHEKNDTDVSTVLVVGDSMADWLAFGLETAFADSPELTVLRKHRTGSSLIVNPNLRSRSFDWVANAREVLAKENVQFVVMMVGLNDRESIREPRQQPAQPQGAQTQQQQRNAQRGRAGAQQQQAAAPAAAATPAAPASPTDQAKPDADASKTPAPVDGAPNDDQAADDTITAPEPQRTGSGTHEFKSERWVELYTKRIDETIAALKSKNVPVFWVGLPPIRGTRSTSDVVFLNDLYKARAEKAGITYIDVWDGFVDESGRFMQQGPDFEGQTRRLRAGDGVHFTQAGARKLAHYVEKEIRRAMTPQGPIAIPLPVEPNAAGTAVATPAPDNTVARPLAGPVLPLNAANDVGDAGELAGGTGPRQTQTDALASRVLINGEAMPVPAGRADDFAWPRRAPAPVDGDPVVARTAIPLTPMLAERPGTKTAEVQPAPAQVRRPSGPRVSSQQREAARRGAQQQQQNFFFFFQRPN
jgi:hypothetical protein